MDQIKYHHVEGQLQLIQNARIPVSDLGLLRGYSIFDYLRFRQMTPIYIEEHLQRLEQSAREIGIELPVTIKEIQTWVQELIQANGLGQGGIRIIVTGGDSPDGYTPTTPRILLLQGNMSVPKIEAKGQHLMSSKHTRHMAAIKTTNYAFPISLRKMMVEVGADDVLYHDDVSITESSRANFFAVIGHKIITPEKHILHGITRKHVLDIAPQFGEVEIGSLPLDALQHCTEAFVTGSTKKAYPVTKVDGKFIGNGQVGPITMAIRKSIDAMEEEYLKRKSNKK